jgi:hypothetical protein
MSKAGRRLIEAAKEALAIARGERKPARIYVPVAEVRPLTGLREAHHAHLVVHRARHGFDSDRAR